MFIVSYARIYSRWTIPRECERDGFGYSISIETSLEDGAPVKRLEVLESIQLGESHAHKSLDAGYHVVDEEDGAEVAASARCQAVYREDRSRAETSEGSNDWAREA